MKSTTKNGTRYRTRKPWTETDERFVCQHYADFATSWIANELGRSVGAVRGKAHEFQHRESPVEGFDGRKPPWASGYLKHKGLDFGSWVSKGQPEPGTKKYERLLRLQGKRAA